MHFELWIVLAFAGSAAGIASWRRRGASRRGIRGAGAAAEPLEGSSADPRSARSIALAGALMVVTSIAGFVLVPLALERGRPGTVATRFALALGLVATGGVLLLQVRREERAGRLGDRAASAGSAGGEARPSGARSDGAGGPP